MLKIRSRLLWLVSKAVANTGDSEDKAGRGGVGLNFATQLADIDVQIVRVSSIAGAPHLFEQHLARHYFTLMVTPIWTVIIMFSARADTIGSGRAGPARCQRVEALCAPPPRSR
jgi:hypothetical protein